MSLAKECLYRVGLITAFAVLAVIGFLTVYFLR